MAKARKMKLTEVQVAAREKTKKFFVALAKEYNLEMARWAFGRVLETQRERASLLKQKSALEAKLRDINAVL